jgi:uncharacterized protein YdeI (YjbR/CyaY-like superfamily)
MPANSDKPFEEFADAAAFRFWLEANHETHAGIRMKIAKKGMGVSTVSYDQALDVALAFGWIDGQKGSFDKVYFTQVFTQRRARSTWSKRNVDKIAVLIESGEMHPAGLAQVEAAKADGRWDRAYEGSAAHTPPPEFLAALEANPAAKEFYATLNSVNRYAIYFRIQNAKRAETRARNVEKFVQMLARGETLY